MRSSWVIPAMSEASRQAGARWEAPAPHAELRVVLGWEFRV